jgi:hypothetical protein
VKVRDAGLAEARVFKGAGVGLPGAVAYRTLRTPGEELIPHSVVAQIEISLENPRVTAKKEYDSLEASVSPHSLVAELHTL